MCITVKDRIIIQNYVNATNKHTQPTKMMYNKQKKEVKS